MNNYTQKQGLERWACPDLSEVRRGLAHHQKSGVELLTGAFMYCLKVSDYDAAAFLRTLRDRIDESPAEHEVTRVKFESAPLQPPAHRAIEQTESEAASWG